MRPLTDRQKVVLEFIRSSVKERGLPPTLREIGTALGIRSNNGVNDHLRALERKGYLTRDSKKSRGLRPVDLVDDSAPAEPDDANVRVPVYRRLVGGQPFADQPVADTLHFDRQLIGGASRDVFGLVVRGDAMLDDGILDGDYLLARRQMSAERGQIVIALIGGEAAIRHFFHEREHVRLQPGNRAMAAIFVRSSDFKPAMILGVAAGVYRRVAPAAPAILA